MSENIIWKPSEGETYNLDREYVLHILEPEPMGEIGGADMHVLELAIQQKESGKFQPLVLINQNDSFSMKLKENNIAHIQCNKLKGKKFGILPYLKNVPNDFKIKVLHSHQYDANYITYLLRKIYPKIWGKIPTVMTCHGWVETNLKAKIKTLMDFYTLKEAKGIIACCRKDIVRLNRFKNKSIIEMISNGVFEITKSSEEEVIEFKKKHNIPLDKKVIGAVGRLSEEKRLDVFLNACKTYSQEDINIHIIIVGSGSKREYLEMLAKKLGISDKVTFTGLVQNMSLVYSTIDVLVLTSDTETTPRVISEAMSLSNPIIATNVGGVPDMIKEGVSGFVVEKGDYNSIAKKLRYIFSDNSVVKSMGAESRKIYLDKFSIKIMQQSIDRLYQKII